MDLENNGNSSGKFGCNKKAARKDKAGIT